MRLTPVLSMALGLAKAGFAPQHINTTVTVHLDTENLRISAIDLDTKAQVPGINEEEFLEQAELAKNNCIVYQALRGPKSRCRPGSRKRQNNVRIILGIPCRADLVHCNLSTCLARPAVNLKR